MAAGLLIPGFPSGVSQLPPLAYSQWDQVYGAWVLRPRATNPYTDGGLCSF